MKRVKGPDRRQFDRLKKGGVQPWNRWRKKHSDERPQLRRARLPGADLRGAMLDRARLDGAILSGAKLLDADLTGACLHEAHIPWANLRNADLSDANLNHAHLKRADLSGARLVNANLWRADLTEADLRDADLTGACLAGAVLHMAHLRGARLDGAQMRNAVLTGATLAMARLRDTDLQNANLRDADLTGASMDAVNLEGATLTGCRMPGIWARDVYLRGVEQRDLRISAKGEPAITVDAFHAARLVSLLQGSAGTRRDIDGVAPKIALVLGNFEGDRERVQRALMGELRGKGYQAIVFGFEGRLTTNYIETVVALARLSRFIIADMTHATAVLDELAGVVPYSPNVPVQPIRDAAEDEPGVLGFFTSFQWFLPVYEYAPSRCLKAQSAKIVGAAARKSDKIRAAAG